MVRAEERALGVRHEPEYAPGPVGQPGDGVLENAHRVDESIGFDELEAGAVLYADAISAFCA
jgi:acetylornithine deacetylase/succinyl-diaminopimelate desuccinylase-like protein